MFWGRMYANLIFVGDNKTIVAHYPWSIKLVLGLAGAGGIGWFDQPEVLAYKYTV